MCEESIGSGRNACERSSDQCKSSLIPSGWMVLGMDQTGLRVELIFIKYLRLPINLKTTRLLEKSPQKEKGEVEDQIDDGQWRVLEPIGRPSAAIWTVMSTDMRTGRNDSANVISKSAFKCRQVHLGHRNALCPTTTSVLHWHSLPAWCSDGAPSKSMIAPGPIISAKYPRSGIERIRRCGPCVQFRLRRRCIRHAPARSSARTSS
jgi:hypothetical protein